MNVLHNNCTSSKRFFLIASSSSLTITLSKKLETSVFAKTDVSNFFDNVIVNDEDEAIKKNRLELVQLLCKTFNNYLNFSNIESA